MHRLPQLHRELPVPRLLVHLRRGGGDTGLTLPARRFREFRFKEAAYRIACPRFDAVTREIVALRRQIERYIEGHPEFGASFSPVPVDADAPPVVQAMARAAGLAGVGPMAAVAGAIAEFAALAARAEARNTGRPLDCIIDNGGDLYMHLRADALVGIYPGDGGSLPPLALRVAPERAPLAVCSSSSRMGHSTSLGDCDLATVVSRDGALADAAATAACNGVRVVGDIQPTLERIGVIAGVLGVIIVKAGRVGLFGDLPPLERVEEAELARKIPGLQK